MKRTAGILLVLAGVCGAVAYWIDLMNFTDLSKGFSTAGSVWVRYGVLGVLLAAALLASLMAARRPVGVQRRNLPVAVFSLLCALAQAGLGGIELFAAWAAKDALTLALGALSLLCAWWMLIQGRFWAADAPKGAPAGGVTMGILGSLYFLLLTCARFAGNASSLYRFAQTAQVFAALAALLFVTVLLRSCFFPESGNGRKLYFSGMWAFYLCTCFELPQALARWMAGATQLGDLAVSAALACTGLMGMACALTALGRESDE